MKRYESVNSYLSVLTLLALLCQPHSSIAATPEVRGTWLTTTGPDHIRGGTNTEQVLSDIRDIGLNTAYVETWKNGYTNYPSATLSAITGGVDRSTFLGSSRDLVQETLIHAHRNEMVHIGWFEYGFAAQFIGSGGTPSNPLANYMKNQGWLLEDQSGNYGNPSNGFAWMNPAVPEVRQFLIDITLEAVNRYDLDGIQFDDRLAWPREFGWDDTTEALYFADTGNSLPGNVNNSAFRSWRQQKVTEFADQLYTAVKAARPDLHVSVSPSITTFSETNFNADWPTWFDNGLFDEFVPQAYRDNITSFNSIINAQVQPFDNANELDKLVVGIRVNGVPPNTPYADVQQMIQRSRTEGAAGHSLWYSKGVRDDFIAGTSTKYAEALTAFYDVANSGHAENPMFASGHRPAPIVATSVAGDIWTVNVTAEDRYRVVALVGTFWEEVNVAHLGTGTHEFAIPGASEVELLVDRRSATHFLGDFDGDLDVDGRDFLIWQRGQGITFGAQVSQGDANLDGIVDGRDLQRVLTNYGWSTGNLSGSVITVPEPSTLSLAGMIVCFASFRRRVST